MKRIIFHTGAALVTLALLTINATAANWTDGMKEGKAAFKSMGPLAFGPEGILLAADTKAAAIVAISTGDTKPAAGNNVGKSFEVDVFEKVDARLASAMAKIPFKVK